MHLDSDCWYDSTNEGYGASSITLQRERSIEHRWLRFAVTKITTEPAPVDI